MAYCHFELCRDCGLGCFSESLLADIRRLSVVAVVFSGPSSAFKKWSGHVVQKGSRKGIFLYLPREEI